MAFGYTNPPYYISAYGIAVKHGFRGSEADWINSILASTLPDGSITTEKLADGAVVMDKLADGAVSEAKLAEESVSEGKLADRAVSADKLAKRVSDEISITGRTISPVYVGDYLAATNAIPSCVLRIGESFFCVDAPTRAAAKSAHDDTGTIRKFDLSKSQSLNREDIGWAKSRKVGHGNSMAYDPVAKRIYIAPIWTYEMPDSGDEVAVHVLHVLNAETWDALEDMTTPSVAMGVSYDHVTGKLYYLDYNYRVWVLINGVWTYYAEIDTDSVPSSDYFSRSYNQDFAVYNGVFFWSSPYGNILTGTLTPGTTKITDAFVVNYTDSASRYQLGELEGMEFSPNGTLYAVDTVSLTSAVQDAFVVELPVGASVANFTGLGGNVFGINDGSITLSEATKTAFSLRSYEIRSLSQLECMLLSGNSSRVTIPVNNDVVDNFDIRINQNVQLYINGHYTVKRFSVFGGILALASENNTHVMEFTDSSMAIVVQRVGSLRLTGQYSLRVKADNLTSGAINNFISIGYDYGDVTVRVMPVSVNDPQKTLMIGQRELVYALGKYIGQTNQSYYQRGDKLTIKSGAVLNGYISADNKELWLTIALAKIIYESATITLDRTHGELHCIGPSGWFGGSESAEKVLITDTTNISVWTKAVGSGLLTIKLTNSSAFTNVTGPAPISVYVADYFSIDVG